jgi:hypothetical protein
MRFKDRALVFFLSLVPGPIFWIFEKRKDWEDWFM